MWKFKMFLAVFIIFLLTSCTIIQTLDPVNDITNQSSEAKSHVKTLVENFGKTLQKVSVLSPSVNEEMKENYSQYVTQDLLNRWISDPQIAPGRYVSSPWPDRIEVLDIQQETSTRYSVEGVIIEITSVEVVDGGAANKIPVNIIVEYEQGDWLITDFEQEKYQW